jgi:hypothetical protein
VVFIQILLKYQLQMTSEEQAMWTHNCCKEVENKLMSGKEPLKLFRDKSNTFNFEDVLKIDAGSIGPSNLFIHKFLKNNLHFQYTTTSNDLTTFKRRDLIKE